MVQKAQIVNLDYPTQVAPGTTFEIRIAVKNISAMTETFGLELINTDTGKKIGGTTWSTFGSGITPTIIKTITMPNTNLNLRFDVFHVE